ncbi:MAG: hypothetical protein GF329_02660 [Candidatus Lokiarchaeota archaeon]|nr:hypothetical protein [Candidatus Lokiarchaeota archaeon]
MQNICINKLEKTGPVMISQYPNNYFKRDELIEIPMKVIPLNAKEGDFTTIIFRNNLIIVSYIFTLQEVDDGRASLLAISATIDDNQINPFSFKNIFESIIEQLKSYNFTDLDNIISLLPRLFHAFSKRKSELKITKSTTIQIEVIDSNKPNKKKKKSKKDRANGMW